MNKLAGVIAAVSCKRTGARRQASIVVDASLIGS